MAMTTSRLDEREGVAASGRHWSVFLAEACDDLGLERAHRE